MIHVYHFARAEHLANILAEGLNPLSSCYRHLHSQLRQNAVYAWLAPSHDRMGYRGHAEYVCLRLTVVPERCFVANMSLISAAYVNWIGAGGQPRNRALAKRLVQAYDETAIPIGQYQSGLCHAPEVVVLGTVEPACLTLCEPDEGERFEDNQRRYQERWERKLRNLAGLADHVSLSELIETLTQCQLIHRVAVHDDSSGWLATYALEDNSEFFTIHLGQDSPLSLPDEIGSQRGERANIAYR